MVILTIVSLRRYCLTFRRSLESYWAIHLYERAGMSITQIFRQYEKVLQRAKDGADG